MSNIFRSDELNSAIAEAYKQVQLKESDGGPDSAQNYNPHESGSDEEVRIDPDDVGEPTEPEEGDIVHDDGQRSRGEDEWFQYGKLFFKGSREGLAQKLAVDNDMMPNIFQISDHGNSICISKDIYERVNEILNSSEDDLHESADPSLKSRYIRKIAKPTNSKKPWAIIGKKSGKHLGTFSTKEAAEKAWPNVMKRVHMHEEVGTPGTAAPNQTVKCPSCGDPTPLPNGSKPGTKLTCPTCSFAFYFGADPKTKTQTASTPSTPAPQSPNSISGPIAKAESVKLTGDWSKLLKENSTEATQKWILFASKHPTGKVLSENKEGITVEFNDDGFPAVFLNYSAKGKLWEVVDVIKNSDVKNDEENDEDIDKKSEIHSDRTDHENGIKEENTDMKSEELYKCQTCSGMTPESDLDEDGDCPDCQKNKYDMTETPTLDSVVEGVLSGKTSQASGQDKKDKTSATWAKRAARWAEWKSKQKVKSGPVDGKVVKEGLTSGYANTITEIFATKVFIDPNIVAQVKKIYEQEGKADLEFILERYVKSQLLSQVDWKEVAEVLLPDVDSTKEYV